MIGLYLLYMYVIDDTIFSYISGEVCSMFTDSSLHVGGLQSSIAIFDDIIAVPVHQDYMEAVREVRFYQFGDVVNPAMAEWMP